MRASAFLAFVLSVALKTSASTSACSSSGSGIGSTWWCQKTASDYDQSCTQDSDCVGIAEGSPCDEGCIDCVTAAINVRDRAKYQSDVASDGIRELRCSCPYVPVGCKAGTCGIVTLPPPETSGPDATDSAVDASVDTGADALSGPAMCMAAGGRCLVGDAASACSKPGPQDCNPDRAPSGSYCCLDELDSSTEAAAGADAASDAAGADAAAD